MEGEGDVVGGGGGGGWLWFLYVLTYLPPLLGAVMVAVNDDNDLLFINLLAIEGAVFSILALKWMSFLFVTMKLGTNVPYLQ
jgi:hypothetical protein